MKIMYHPVFLKHDTGNHPENIRRLAFFADLPAAKIADGEKYLELYHTPAYIERVKRTLTGRLDPDTAVSPGSFEAAVAAVGASVTASEIGGFALVRPPGHHALPDRSGGFCIFNNIGIAVQRLVSKNKKVLILDFDGHHGNGTAAFFAATDRVLYISLHQAEVFPGTGSADETGTGPGQGYTINFPLPAGSGDDVYREALSLIRPTAEDFGADAVAVSAGFDTHWRDTLLNLKTSVNLYHEIGWWLGQKFKKVFGVLEGGYVQEIVKKGVENFAAGVNLKPAPHREKTTVSTAGVLAKARESFDKLKKNGQP